MKKTLTICALVASFIATAQEGAKDLQKIEETVSQRVADFKERIKTKKEIVNRAVEKGILTREEANKIIEKYENNKIESLVDIIDYAEVEQDYYWESEGNEEYSEEDIEALLKELEGEVDTTEIKPNFKRYSKTPKIGGLFVGVGFANLAQDNHFPHSDFGYSRSSNYEWGILRKIPFSKENNAIGLKYGLSFNYYSLHATENRVFVKDNKDVSLTTYPVELKKDRSYFRNTYITIPLLLEFDFSTKKYGEETEKIVTKDGMRLSVGGHLGYRINSKQFLYYTNDLGHKVKEIQKGNWNVTDFQYGLQAALGYGAFELYGKYDLNPTFKNKPENMNMWSLGLRIELFR